MKIRILNILFLVIAAPLSLFALEKNVKGKISTHNNIPIARAAIQVKSSKQIFYSDSLGTFSISCTANDKIKITAGGFASRKIKIGEKTNFISTTLRLKPGSNNQEKALRNKHINSLNELYSVSKRHNNDLDFSQFNDIYDLISNRFPGVTINSNGEIIVRGNATLISSNAALLVVNGVIVDQSVFSNLLPTEIKSINILKDAGAAEYGSRGANGVVRVQTKSQNSF